MILMIPHIKTPSFVRSAEKRRHCGERKTILSILIDRGAEIRVRNQKSEIRIPGRRRVSGDVHLAVAFRPRFSGHRNLAASAAIERNVSIAADAARLNYLP